MKRQKNKMPANSLISHLRELLFRTLACVFCLVLSGTVVYFFYEHILNLLRSPLNAPLYYNNPAGSFTLIMRVCFIGALTVTIPVIIYNIIMFIRPAFPKSLSLKRVYFTTFMSSVLAILGAVFAYLCILPGTLEFFSGFRVSGLSALISADNYLNFVINMIIAFIIIFQLPLIIMLADTISKIPPKKLIKNEKWVVFGSIVVAIVTPFNYDLITSLFVAIPIITLYNLSILLVGIRHLGQKKHVKKTAVESYQSAFVSVPDVALPITPSLASNFPLTEPKTGIIMKTPQKRTSMDIIIKNKVSKPVQKIVVAPKPAVQNHTIATQQKVHYFSDISRKPHVNHAISL